MISTANIETHQTLKIEIMISTVNIENRKSNIVVFENQNYGN